MEKEQLIPNLEPVSVSRTARLHFSNKEKVDLPVDYSQRLWMDLQEDNVKINGFLTVGKTTYSLFQLTKIEWMEEPYNYGFMPMEFENFSK
ncbi:hypothetical protein A374_18144 [Fictibacillus macauensis ZFHKF-1]|uniref:Uncharacterized protein n=1 Tax=Fictibacillus macauensis ZFHKF-1 TaxID=1196324 RepID=I8AEI5_9BACL|nr:hypothetical protein [Fictibacillus macauensis]EIT83982.1 hypothetical protein A374_18144 [Fictibacillus macauensis ZFHKF-1]